MVNLDKFFQTGSFTRHQAIQIIRAIKAWCLTILDSGTEVGVFGALDFGANLTVTDNGDGTATIDGSAAGAPVDAEYLVGALNPTLTNERLVTDTTSNKWDLTTPGTAKVERAALTGDVTAAQNSNATTIANDAVTYAKMQNASANVYIGRVANTSGDLGEVAMAASQLAGRGSSGDIAAITLGTGLSMVGTTLNSSGGITRGQALALPFAT